VLLKSDFGFGVQQKSSLLSKSSSLAAALGVTQDVKIIASNFFTFDCATEVCFSHSTNWPQLVEQKLKLSSSFRSDPSYNNHSFKFVQLKSDLDSS
jgi:hypothetical protein